MEKILWMVVLVISVVSFLVFPLLQQRNRKKENESYLQFQKNLKVGDSIVMASGIFGEIIAIEETKYKVSIAADTVIEVMPGSIVGIDRAKQDKLK